MLLEQLVTFSRVVDVGSFTRAAELLSLSQPSVTRQVALLEREFGVPLIERTGRKLVVTPAGHIVHEHARSAAALLERARSDVKSLAHPEHGQVSVASATTVRALDAADTLEQLSRALPRRAVPSLVWPD